MSNNLKINDLLAGAVWQSSPDSLRKATYGQR